MVLRRSPDSICSESANSDRLFGRRTAYRRLRFCQYLDSHVLAMESAGFCICLYSLSTFNCSRNCGSTRTNFLAVCIAQQQTAEDTKKGGRRAPRNPPFCRICLFFFKDVFFHANTLTLLLSRQTSQLCRIQWNIAFYNVLGALTDSL